MSVVEGAGPWSVTDRPGWWRATVAGIRPSGWSLGRRGVQLVLGALWILDGALQFQPGMFTSQFADGVMAPAAAGQPGWVAWPVLHGARVVASHAVVADLGVALVQLALGIGLVVPRTVRPALVASVAWALGVWSMGEGLGGIAGGTVSFLTGAPGAALLYGLLALAAWPRPTTNRSTDAVAADAVASVWFPRAWAGLWVALGATTLLPANRSASRLASQLATAAGAAPGSLGHLDRAVAGGLRQSGGAAVALFVLVPVAVGLAGLGGPRVRRVAAWAGIALAAAAWALGQCFGQLLSGSATDPNTGPLLVVCGLALLGTLRHGHPVVPPVGTAGGVTRGWPPGRTGAAGG